MMSPVQTQSSSTHWLSVVAPARLHLGFVDLNGRLGRRFGSLGLALEQPYTQIMLRRAKQFSSVGPDSERALNYATRLLKQLDLSEPLEIIVERAIPAHSGLGSGTQLALAVGSGIARLFELDLTLPEIAHSLQRGARSGIGIGAFEQGGFLVDGGRAENTGLPPLTVRLPVPQQWHVLLIFDDHQQGVHGRAEQQAFADLPEFSDQQAGEISRLLLMQALPAIAERDFNGFSQAIRAIQYHIGHYFAPLQGGGPFTSDKVAAVLEWLGQQGIVGVGQSSWGPTGFAFIDGEDRARALLKLARQHWRNVTELQFMLSKPRNTPGVVNWLEDNAPSAGPLSTPHSGTVTG